MKAGIVGLPNVGKSTLFNCLSNAKAQSANFPFCTIEPNIGVVNVPDARLEKLEALVNPERVLPAPVEIVDIAGLVKGASKGEGLGNQFLANIRETDAILHVLRCFDNDNVVHVDGSIDPIRDKETIDMELQLKDLETVEKKLDKVKRAAKTGNKEAQKEETALLKIKEGLEAGQSFDQIALDWNVGIIETESIKRDSSEVDGDIARLAFTMSKPQGSSVYEGFEHGNGDYSLVELVAVESSAAEASDERVKSLTTAVAGQEYQSVLKLLASRADVVRTPAGDLEY